MLRAPDSWLHAEERDRIEGACRRLWGDLVSGARCASPREVGHAIFELLAQFDDNDRMHVPCSAHSIIHAALMRASHALAALLENTPDSVWNDAARLEHHKQRVLDATIAHYNARDREGVGRKPN